MFLMSKYLFLWISDLLRRSGQDERVLGPFRQCLVPGPLKIGVCKSNKPNMLMFRFRPIVRTRSAESGPGNAWRTFDTTSDIKSEFFKYFYLLWL